MAKPFNKDSGSRFSSGICSRDWLGWVCLFQSPMSEASLPEICICIHVLIWNNAMIVFIYIYTQLCPTKFCASSNLHHSMSPLHLFTPTLPPSRCSHAPFAPPTLGWSTIPSNVWIHAKPPRRSVEWTWQTPRSPQGVKNTPRVSRGHL